MTGTRLAGLVLPERGNVRCRLALPDEPGTGTYTIEPFAWRPGDDHIVCTGPIDVSHGSSRLADRRHARSTLRLELHQIGGDLGTGGPDRRRVGVYHQHTDQVAGGAEYVVTYPPRRCLVSTRSISCITSPTWRNRSSSSPMEWTCRGSGYASFRPPEGLMVCSMEALSAGTGSLSRMDPGVRPHSGVRARRTTLLPCAARSLVRYISPYSSATRRDHGRDGSGLRKRIRRGIRTVGMEKAFRRIPGGYGQFGVYPRFPPMVGSGLAGGLCAGPVEFDGGRSGM